MKRLAASAKAAFAKVTGGFTGTRQTLVSLVLVAACSVVAGVFLAKNTERLEEFPGLLLMVPAAIALRGNIFGAMGSRLGTAIHEGTYKVSFRPAFPLLFRCNPLKYNEIAIFLRRRGLGCAHDPARPPAGMVRNPRRTSCNRRLYYAVPKNRPVTTARGRPSARGGYADDSASPRSSRGQAPRKSV